MYFPRLYPDELLYSAIARCRVHLGMSSHKTLLDMLFNDSKVAAITDLPTHLTTLANNTGLDAEDLITNHTLFPLYAPFLPQERRVGLYQAMLASERTAIGLAGAAPALVKWPKWLRFCPACFEDMASCFGEPYWRRFWQVQGIEVCLEHGCHLLNSPIPFRRAQRHEFHPASPLFIPEGFRIIPASEEPIRFAMTAAQLLELKDVRSPSYGRWTNFYRHLATVCGAKRGRQVRADIMWEKILLTHRNDWLVTNNLLVSSELPQWFLALFRKHRKSFSALQHLIVWTSLCPGQEVGEIIREANIRQGDISLVKPRMQLPEESGKRRRCRYQWQQLLDKYGGAKAAKENGGKLCCAWLYRHDRYWLMTANKASFRRKGNNRCIDWRKRDKALVRLLIRIDRETEENLGLPRRSRSWFLMQLPHRASVERHLDQLSLCRAFLERYAESVYEYQIRRLTKAMVEDTRVGITSKRWELERRCGLNKYRMAPLTTAFLKIIGY